MRRRSRRGGRVLACLAGVALLFGGCNSWTPAASYNTKKDLLSGQSRPTRPTASTPTNSAPASSSQPQPGAVSLVELTAICNLACFRLSVWLHSVRRVRLPHALRLVLALLCPHWHLASLDELLYWAQISLVVQGPKTGRQYTVYHGNDLRGLIARKVIKTDPVREAWTLGV